MLAPLAKEAGGEGLCAGAGQASAAIFADTADPDYRILLESIAATKQTLDGM